MTTKRLVGGLAAAKTTWPRNKYPDGKNHAVKYTSNPFPKNSPNFTR